MTAPDVPRGSRRPESLEIGLLLEGHRVELTGYCYRILGSGFEAEDAVQETLIRAWRSFSRFDPGRAPLLSWLHAIATRVCFDMLRTVARETIRLAFVAALQHLPPRQRAVLILRDVLCWKADEAARLLDTTAAAVNSALQRARATLAARDLTSFAPLQPGDEVRERLLTRYMNAFERDDVEALVSLLHEDAAMSMPPFEWWLRGRAEIRRALLAADLPCHGSRLVRTAASGSPAFGQYRPTGVDGRYEPFALVVVEVSGGLITETTTYLDATRLFPLFALPAHLAA